MRAADECEDAQQAHPSHQALAAEAPEALVLGPNDPHANVQRGE